MAHKLALIGFGTVGQGLAEILLERHEMLWAETGLEFEIVAISDAMKGALYDPAGLDMALALDLVTRTGTLDDYPDNPSLRRGWDSLKTIRDTNADTVIEVTFTNVHTGQPAIDHCRAAFEAGKNVITSNKGPVALKYAELSQLAEVNGVSWGIEGTVMSGTPTLRMPTVSLVGNQIREIRGILNGTTNYILTQMEEGKSYADALAEAQRLGYAEADPTSDVEGYDAMYKVLILSNVIMGNPLSGEQVKRTGISQITPDDVAEARAAGKRWKLIARVGESQDGVYASVGPEMLSLTDPLAGVTGTTNAITYDCDLLGPITVMGAGAGRMETGFSLLIDLINIAKTQSQFLQEVHQVS